jgi:hypothetical protein
MHWFQFSTGSTIFARGAFVSRKNEDIQMSIGKRKRTLRRASSIDDAMQLCLEAAMRKHNRGPKRISELMGAKLDTFYKWLAESRMPINMIGAFENACGATYLTEYLCANAHLLAVEIPTGRKLTEKNVMDLQASFSDAMGMLIRFYKGDVDRDETLAGLDQLMADLGWHKANVERADEPELEFGGNKE